MLSKKHSTHRYSISKIYGGKVYSRIARRRLPNLALAFATSLSVAFAQLSVDAHEAL